MTDLPTGTVTFLFTDLEGSTQLWERQPEAMSAALARHDRLLRRAVENHEGHVFKTGGDAFCVAFGSAPDALAAAVEAQAALHAEPWSEPGPLRARAALHTGAAELREGDYFGPALNRTARLLAIGHGGQTLLSHSTAELVCDALPEQTALRDLGPHRLKDMQRPEEVFQLVHAELPDEFPPLRSLDALPHNLPLQPTSFIGRERQLASLRGLLATHHLLTLTGPGGSGKTRLALQLAAELLESYPEGVWLVDLAALTDPALVPQTVATALGVREVPGRALTQTLTESLKPRRLLLVLDNCEHVVDACAQLATVLLRACPDVTLLVTSREALATSGEVVWQVPSLSAPDPRRLLPSTKDLAATLTQYEAVRLFIERASLARPGFSVTSQNGPAVAQICHRLDGIPLAIELAAGRTKAFSPEQIAGRLDDRFKLLTGGSRTALPRYQTLRAAMDWSYDLLSEPERRVLRRLSVFASGWTLEAAEKICEGEGIEGWEVLELQAHLIDKSLVIAEADPRSETRYRLLGTVRQYAGDRLLEAGESARLRDRHLEWFLDLGEKAAPELRGPEQAQWLDRLEQEHDNLRAALEWSQSQEGGAEAGVRLAGALVRFWYVHGYSTEGRHWLEAALSRSAGAAARARAKALRGLGALAMQQGDLQRAEAFHEQSVSLYRELGDKRGLARALSGLGLVQLERGEHDRSKLLLEEGLVLARETDAREVVASLLINLGELARLRGDHGAARALYEESLEASGEGSTQTRAVSLLDLGMVALSQNDIVAAHRRFQESLATSEKLGNTSLLASALEGIAAVCNVQGQPERAAQLFGAAEVFRRAINVCVAAADRAEYERAVAAARARLGDAAFASTWAEGETMGMEQAIAYAQEERGRESAAVSGRATGGEDA